MQKNKKGKFCLWKQGTMKFDGILTVTLKPKSQKSHEHIVLWGYLSFALETIPVVGFA